VNQADFLKAAEAGEEKTGRPPLWNHLETSIACSGFALTIDSSPDALAVRNELRACLWAEHLRVWLAERHVYLERRPGTYQPVKCYDCEYEDPSGGATEYLWADGTWRVANEDGSVQLRHYDYYSALITARDAIKEE
jgi:hypothetical protein